MRAPLLGLVVASAVSLGPSVTPARAQGNDRSAPTGGRSALMGNTGVALGEDGAAPFLNPATIVRINDRSLAFSVNFYTFSSINFSNWHQPGAVATPTFGQVALSGTGIGTNGFSALPSTLCLFFTVAGVTAEGEPNGVLHKGRQKLAACLGSVEAVSVNLSALAFRGTVPGGSTTQVESLAVNWNRLHVGPSYSVSLTDDFAIGLSLHGVATIDTFSVEGDSLTSTVGGGAIQSSLGAGGSGHAVNLTAILGATYRLGPVTLGASAQLPSVHVYGAYNGILHSQSGTSGAATDTATLTSGTGTFAAPPPVRVAVGVGGEWKRLNLELDAAYDFATSAAIGTNLQVNTASLASGGVAPSAYSATYSVPSQATWSAGAGAEYFLSPSFSVIGGVSTNLSTLPGLAPAPPPSLGNLVQSRTSSASLSFGAGSYGAAGDLLLGVQLGYGWGQAIAVNPYVSPNDWAVIDTQTYSAMVILAGATNLRTITRAVEKMKNVVETGKPEDPPPSPPAPGPRPPIPRE